MWNHHALNPKRESCSINFICSDKGAMARWEGDGTQCRQRIWIWIHSQHIAKAQWATLGNSIGTVRASVGFVPKYSSLRNKSKQIKSCWHVTGFTKGELDSRKSPSNLQRSNCSMQSRSSFKWCLSSNIILWGSYPLAESIYHFVGFPRVDIPNATSLATFLTYLQLSWGTHATPARASDENRLHHDLYNDSTRYSRYSYKELL